jgi:glycosyltransferase involved in cell wall biosynthesis
MIFKQLLKKLTNSEKIMQNNNLQIPCTMIVLNDVKNDSRVKKCAKALQKANCNVTIFGLSSDKEQRDVKRIEIQGIPTLLFPNPRFTILSSAVRIYTRKYVTQGLLAAMWKYINMELPYFIHTHDFHSLIIGKELSLRLKKEGHDVKWVHDFHEYVKGLDGLDDEIKELSLIEEHESILHADYLTTVSPTLSTALRKDYNLDKEPTVLYNAPNRSNLNLNYDLTIRKKLNLSTDIDLGVYIGGISELRGLHTLIGAMPLVPHLHIALVTETKGKYMDSLIESAKELGCYDRLHILPYVDSTEITSFLQDATFGIHPMVRYGNAEVALPNKLFDYIHAKIPVIVSNCTTMEQFVDKWKIGLVFEAENVNELGNTIKKLLKERAKFTENINDEILDNFSWETSEKQLKNIYSGMMRELKGGIDNIDNSFIKGWVNKLDFKHYEGIAVFHKKEMISQLRLQSIFGTVSNKKKNGFSILLPEKYHDDVEREYEVQLLPRGDVLKNGKITAKFEEEFPINGNFEGVVDNKITGWVKLKNFDYPTGVTIYYNEKYVCSGAADIILEDKPGCLGFSVTIPELYRDGKARKYWVKTDPWDIEIKGSPQILKFD